MHSKTDTQGGRARADTINKRPDQSEVRQIPHSVPKRTDTWQNQLCGLTDILRIGCHAHVAAETPQRILDAAQIVQFVINYRNHEKLRIEHCTLRIQ
jgi:hypothetical protein